MQLQRQLYSQLHEENEQVPDKATDTIENQLRQLRKIAAKRLILVVLDGVQFCVSCHVSRSLCSLFHISDMWDAEHEWPFSCIDPETASKLLVVSGICSMSSFPLLDTCTSFSDDSHQGHLAEGVGG